MGDSLAEECMTRMTALEDKMSAYVQRELEDYNPIDDGDTAWVLCASIWVIFMTIPGQAIFYGGELHELVF